MLLVSAGPGAGRPAKKRQPGDPLPLVRECRRLMPDVGIQVPPNLADWWDELVTDGATDLGGLSANGDHISPEQAFPSPHQVRKRLQPQGYAFTSQLYFDDALTDRVHAQAPYARKGPRTVRNADDGIFAEGGEHLVLSLTAHGEGYAATFAIGLQVG